MAQLTTPYSQERIRKHQKPPSKIDRLPLHRRRNPSLAKCTFAMEASSHSKHYESSRECSFVKYTETHSIGQMSDCIIRSQQSIIMLLLLLLKYIFSYLEWTLLYQFLVFALDFVDYGVRHLQN